MKARAFITFIHLALSSHLRPLESLALLADYSRYAIAPITTLKGELSPLHWWPYLTAAKGSMRLGAGARSNKLAGARLASSKGGRTELTYDARRLS